jgi:hypothetical protein
MFDLLDPRRLSFAVESLLLQPATTVPCLSAQECDRLAVLADQLTYRSATPVTGTEDALVYQDFELNYSLPPNHPFWKLAMTLEGLMSLAVTKISVEWVSPATYTINDLIIQRYPPGCKGITPHRDHMKYRMVVAILLVSGDGEFRIHKQRDACNGEVIRFGPGELLLMGAPGIFPGFLRPFHSVTGVSRLRRTIGMRYDSRIIPRGG